MKALKSAWKKWLKIARAIGNFQGQVILTIFYFILVLPFGIGVAIFADPMNMKRPGLRSNFSKWKHPTDNLETARRQY